MRERIAAAKEISAQLRQLKMKAQAQDLKMVAYLVNLAELEALDCAASVEENTQFTHNKRA